MPKRTRIEPLFNLLHVRRDVAEDKTESGLFLPDTTKEPLNRGVVIAVGPGRTLENGLLLKPTVRVGDKVLFGKYGGTEIEVDKESLLMLREEEVLGIIREEEFCGEGEHLLAHEDIPGEPGAFKLKCSKCGAYVTDADIVRGPNGPDIRMAKDCGWPTPLVCEPAIDGPWPTPLVFEPAVPEPDKPEGVAA